MVLASLNKLGNADSQAIADMTRLPRTTVFRLMETLRAQGYVARSLKEEVYYPTRKVGALSAGYNHDNQLRETAVPVLASITDKIGWPAGISTFDAFSMVIRESTYGQTPFSVDSMIAGKRLSILRSASGLAYISFCAPSERHSILRHLGRLWGQNSDVIADAHRNIEAVRANGYALYRGTSEPRTVSLGLPIKRDGVVLGCLSAMWIASALDVVEAVDRYRPVLAEARTVIEHRMSLPSP